MNSKSKKIILFIVVIVVLLAVIIGGVYFIENGFKKDRGTTSHQRITEQTLIFGDDEYKVTHNIESYLLIGVDDNEQVDRPTQKEVQTDAEGNYLDEDGDPIGTEVETYAAPDPNGYVGGMADFLLLLVLDRTENTYGFVQINRNTMTDVPFIDAEGNGDTEVFEQICAAHWYGGNEEMSCQNTVDAVSDLCGDLQIDGYYSIEMSAIAKLNHAVGGVEVTLEDDFTKQDPAMKKGETITLTDEQAQLFVRARMGVGEGDNQARMRRQQDFMESFRNKAFDKMEADPKFADELIQTLEDEAVTNVPSSTLSKIVNQVYKSSYLGILQPEGETVEHDTFGDGILHEEFYIDEKSLAKIVSLLCGIDYTDVEAYNEDDEDIDWEEYERLHGGEEYVEDDPNEVDDGEETAPFNEDDYINLDADDDEELPTKPRTETKQDENENK